jgi:hypothetical protein
MQASRSDTRIRRLDLRAIRRAAIVAFRSA